MAEELRLDVVTIAHSKGLTDAARDVKKLKGETDDLGTSMGESADASDGLTKSLDEQGKEVAQARAEVKKLNDEVERSAKVARGGAGPVPIIPGKSAGDGSALRAIEANARSLTEQIAKSRETVKGLEAELTKVGNNAGIRKALRIERSWLNDLERIGKTVAAEATKVGSAAGIELMSAMNASFKGAASTPVLGPILIGALVAAAAAAAPLIGGVIGGAVVGAVGVGGIAGGIVAAAGDNRVKEAWKGFTSSLSGDDFGRQAFAGPVIESIGIIKKGLADLHLGEALSKGADAVPTLAKGVTNFAQNVMPGFNSVMSRSGEISDIVATGLGDLGGALGSLIGNVAASKGSMDGLRWIFVEGSAAIRGTGNAMASLGDGFHSSLNWLIPLGQATADYLTFLPVQKGWVQDNVDAFKEIAGQGKNVTFTLGSISDATQLLNMGLDPLQGYLEASWKNFDDLNKSMDDYLSKNLNADQATLAFKEDILGLKQAVKEHGTSLSDNTKNGLDNQKMIQGLIGDAQRVRDATYAQTGSVQAADAAYKNQIDTLKIVLEKLGFTKKQIDSMVGDYNINVITTFKTVGSAAKATQLTLKEDRFDRFTRAAGGPVQAGVPYQINERGYETVTFPAGGTVHPANLTPMAGGGAGATYNVNVYAAPFTSPVEIGATVVAAVKQYEMANGSGWRA